MALVLFDDHRRDTLLPLTFTRPVGGLRIGILTLCEKWEKQTGQKAGYYSREYLRGKYPLPENPSIWINGGLCPDSELAGAVNQLREGEGIRKGEDILAYAHEGDEPPAGLSSFKWTNWQGDIRLLKNPWDIFQMNAVELERDYELLTADRQSAAVSSTNTVLGERVFLEEGAKVECSTLNAHNGPIYIGKDAEIMEGCHIRGGLAMGAHSQLKMGAKIYGAVSLGEWCKVGGEVNNSIFQAYSNKGHDGFLGNSVIGEWCNIGADTNNSNLKNNYDEIKLWSYPEERFVNTGLQFCGLIMGDHSKCGINTMFNTGTVVGVSANIFGSGFPRNFIPSFSWGGAGGLSTYRTDRAFDTAARVMERRDVAFTQTEKDILMNVFEQSRKWRKSQ